ncbi:MAG: precorrin-2 C(20)-methyltransferase [Eubacteriales bacterium]|nr:precorrin-2 C(20)-methyltransferase [Eubacteriales bacterium]
MAEEKTPVQVYLIGMGPGSADYVLPAALKIIRRSKTVYASGRLLKLLEEIEPHMQEQIQLHRIDQDLHNLAPLIHDQLMQSCENTSGDIAVLVTGDSGYFSLAGLLRKQLAALMPEIEIISIPGISSMQYLASSAGIAWQDIESISLHGRVPKNWLRTVKQSSASILLTGNKPDMQTVLKQLEDAGLGDQQAYIGENLSYENEKIYQGRVSDLSCQSYDTLSLLLLLRDRQNTNGKHELWPWQTPGISDDLFVRGEVPMTKQDMRAIIISELHLRNDSVVWDVGAGTGSVSIEAARICSSGHVYAIERNSEAVRLIRSNAANFALSNISVVHETAHRALPELPAPDCVFIGGSKNELPSIIRQIVARARQNHIVRLVMTAITLETIPQAISELNGNGQNNYDIKQITVNRTSAAGDKTMMRPQTPVWVLTADISTNVSAEAGTESDVGSEAAAAPGCLFGVGVGPGDPELITVRALNLIRDTDVLAVPCSESGRESMALNIVAAHLSPAQLAGKKIIDLEFPMTRDKNLLRQKHHQAAAEVIKYLKTGKSVVFITIGDPGVFSTYQYLAVLVGAAGYNTETIAGVPAFCAAAARASINLTEQGETLKIMAAPRDVSELEEALSQTDTLVLMKAGQKLPVIRQLLTNDKRYIVRVVDSCGLPQEKINDLRHDDNYSYFTTVIIRKNKQNTEA